MFLLYRRNRETKKIEQLLQRLEREKQLTLKLAEYKARFGEIKK